MLAGNDEDGHGVVIKRVGELWGSAINMPTLQLGDVPPGKYVLKFFAAKGVEPKSRTLSVEYVLEVAQNTISVAGDIVGKAAEKINDIKLSFTASMAKTQDKIKEFLDALGNFEQHFRTELDRQEWGGFFDDYKDKANWSQRSSPLSAEGANTPPASIGDVNPHCVVPPAHWCITVSQIQTLLAEVDQQFPHEDPTAYKVVNSIIKPRTRAQTPAQSVSYALLHNPRGIDVSTFMSHAWAEGFKEFGRSIRGNTHGGLWMCFTANPQNWGPSELDKLLGENVYQSPFAIALREADRVVVVRNSTVNVHTRLWCVFELFLAMELNKPITALGPLAPQKVGEPIGSRATCSNPADTAKLRLAIAGKEQKVDTCITDAMRS